MHAAMKLGCVLFVICSQAIVVTLSCAEQLKEVMAEKKFGECTSQNKNEISMLNKEAYCKPRPTLVRIFSMDNNYLVSPYYVTVDRCSGYCPQHKACLPTSSGENIVSKPAQWKNIMLDQFKADMCGMVEVMEHTKCRCGCAIKPENCSEDQVYDKRRCVCMCANMAMMDACTRKPDWIWNQTNCRCECAKEKKCSTPNEWIQGRCACGKVMDEESLEDNKIVDDEQN